MDFSQERLNALAAAPSESLAIELKRWIDPSTPEGTAKIAKAAMALRNRNGGYLVIGFDNATLQPDTENQPADVAATFTVDVIQGLVSKYAFPLFEIQLGFAERDGQAFPVIGVPEGVRVPVACRRDLAGSDNKMLLREDVVYFRTLNANGTPSSSAAKAAAWAEMVEICFENREADIGRFLRRQLGSEGGAGFLGLLQPQKPPPTLEERTVEFNARAEFAKQQAFEKDNLTAKAAKLGSWSVALLMDPPREVLNLTTEFLNTVGAANSNYSGWPMWLDSRGFTDKGSAPRKNGKFWECILNSIGGWSSHLDYQLMDARGEFYLWRALQDDLTDKAKPGTVLDPGLMLYRVSEAIAVGLSFAKALHYDENATLGFYFRWQKLQGRELYPWANRQMYISAGQTAYDDAVEGFVAIPALTPPNAIAPYVREATLNLFAAFEGFEFPYNSIEKLAERVVSRQ